MLWLIACLIVGVLVGIRWSPPPIAVKWLHHSLTFSLVLLLVGLGMQVGNNPQLAHALSRYAIAIGALLAFSALASIAWGIVLERGWRNGCRRASP